MKIFLIKFLQHRKNKRLKINSNSKTTLCMIYVMPQKLLFPQGSMPRIIEKLQFLNAKTIHH